MNLLPKKRTDLININYASHNRFVDVMRTFAESSIKSTQSLLHWILHQYYMPFLGHEDWPTWVPNLAQHFTSAHWGWPINTEGSACPNIPCSFSLAIARVTRKHPLVCDGMKIDVIHMVTENMMTDTVRKKSETAQRLANSITRENAARIHPILENLRALKSNTIIFHYS
jgi:hypothetical protein